MPVGTDSVSPAKVEEEKGVTKKPIETVQEKQIKSEFYAIQVATFQDRKRAENLVNQLKDKKYSPLYIKTKGKLVEVYVGKFASPRESWETLSKLRKDFHDAFTRKIQSPFDEM